VRDILGLKTEIVGVQSSAANAYVRSIAEGGLVTTSSAATRADGMAVRTPHPAALEYIRGKVDDMVEVDDDAIGQAIRTYWTDTHNLAEGAGAAALAAAMAERSRLAGKRVGVVLTGGNIDLALFRDWVG
jgi:threonine dehydratase